VRERSLARGEEGEERGGEEEGRGEGGVVSSAGIGG